MSAESSAAIIRKMAAKNLTILCITKAEPHAEPFLLHLRELARELGAEFVIGVDHDRYTREGWLISTHARTRLEGSRLFRIESDGYIESVLDPMISVCTGDYILRLDDDERVSRAMRDWLKDKQYEAADHWAFPRANLWGDEQHFIANAPLWPDLQTRLSVKAKAGGRTRIHEGSPYGTGEVAPVCIEHHLFLLRSEGERIAKAARYDQLQPGMGSGHYLAFSVPEVLPNGLIIHEFDNDGACRTESGYQWDYKWVPA